MASRFNLSEQEQNELLPTAKQTRFSNRVAWAKSYLQQADLLNSSRRGHFQITDRGRTVLAEKPPRIDIQFLERFAEFREFRDGGKGDSIVLARVIDDRSSHVEALQFLNSSAQLRYRPINLVGRLEVARLERWRLGITFLSHLLVTKPGVSARPVRGDYTATRTRCAQPLPRGRSVETASLLSPASFKRVLGTHFGGAALCIPEQGMNVAHILDHLERGWQVPAQARPAGASHPSVWA